MSISTDLYKKAKKLIPGGTQLLSKRPEMFLPDLWPSYFSKAKGCEVWDLDGNKYIDMSYMGIGTNILGYADPDVNEAIHKIVDDCNSSTLNPPEEVELAEILIKLHPWANMARFARTGGEAMAIAIRIARAYSGKDKILFCGYHGWHDWYLAANLSENSALDGHLIQGLNPSGVPKGLTGTAIPFKYNNVEEFESKIQKYHNEIGAIVMEPIRNEHPKDEFLNVIRHYSNKYNILLIIDEITSGWRLHFGGAHLLFEIEPDIAVFAKGMSNGYPMAAIIGKGNVMQKAQETFISSTYWTERIGPAAAIATIEKLKKCSVAEYLNKKGEYIKQELANIANKYNLDISVYGTNALIHFSFNHVKFLALKTLFTQQMIDLGFLATNAIYLSFAHTEKYIEKYLSAVDKSFYILSQALTKNTIDKLLKTEVCQSGFQRLT